MGYIVSMLEREPLAGPEAGRLPIAVTMEGDAEAGALAGRRNG
jgi:hypothetical protein